MEIILDGRSTPLLRNPSDIAMTESEIGLANLVWYLAGTSTHIFTNYWRNRSGATKSRHESVMTTAKSSWFFALCEDPWGSTLDSRTSPRIISITYDKLLFQNLGYLDWESCSVLSRFYSGAWRIQSWEEVAIIVAMLCPHLICLPSTYSSLKSRDCTSFIIKSSVRRSQRPRKPMRSWLFLMEVYKSGSSLGQIKDSLPKATKHIQNKGCRKPSTSSHTSHW